MLNINSNPTAAPARQRSSGLLKKLTAGALGAYLTMMPTTAKADTKDLQKLREQRIAKADAEIKELKALSKELKKSSAISQEAKTLRGQLKEKSVGKQEAFEKLVALNDRANGETPKDRGDNISVRFAAKKIAKGLIIKDPKDPNRTIVVESKVKELGLKMPPKAKAAETSSAKPTSTEASSASDTKTAAKTSTTEGDTRSKEGKALASLVPSNVQAKD